jgi:uncharacterized protein (DUF885 family)
MNARALLALLWLAASACATASAVVPAAAPSASEDARFSALLEEEWEYGLRESPTVATFLGDPRYNDRLEDLSPEAIERREQHARELLQRLKGIDRARLSEAQQLNYDLFLLDAQQEVEGQRFPEEYLQLSQLGGVHTQLARLAQSMPKGTAKDYEDFVKRLRALPVLVDQSIALLRKGAEAGVTPPKVTLRDVAGLIRNQIVDVPEKSPIYTAAFAGLPPALQPEEARLRAEVAAAIGEAAVPAYRKLLAFFEAEYLPRARESVGMATLPDGEAWYAFRVKQQTTTDLTPEAIHELGMAEVRRIRAEMEKVKAEAGFPGELRGFFHVLRTDPRFYFTSREALLMAYRDMAKRVDPELPRLFRTLPRLPYGIRPVPEYSEKTTPTAYYQPGALEAGRAGYFYANTYDLAVRPKWEMDTLVLHEAVPGHHFQIALAQELGELPAFRRHGGYGAYTEGWGLYAESLGAELGLFQDPYARFGRLSSEMWRAIRLVVDTGLHHMGWTREQALFFFRENLGKSEHDITVEVDRYIVNPAQALTYKVGELKIQELRALAARELGPRFDVRAFHDVVLGAGALPLNVLEARVKAWVAREKRGE